MVRRRVNTSLSAPFEEEGMGLDLYAGEEGGVHVKMQKGMLVQFLGLKFEQIFGGGGGVDVENWL